jgi:hypothetical protein
MITELIRDMGPEWAGRAIEKTNPSNGTMALGSTQPLTEMSSRNLS